MKPTYPSSCSRCLALLAALLVLLGTLACDESGPFVVYMSPDGDDSRTGASLGEAVATLQRAHDLIAAGIPQRNRRAMVRIAPGLYRDQEVAWRFTMPGHTITLRPLVASERPVFDASNLYETRPEDDLPVWLDMRNVRLPGTATNLVVEGMDIRHYFIAINFQGDRSDPNDGWVSHNIVRDNLFTDIGRGVGEQFGYKVIGLVNAGFNRIEGNTFSTVWDDVSCDHLHAIYLAHHAQNNVITGNVFEEGCGDPIRLRDDSSGNLIFDNTFVDIGRAAFATDWLCEDDIAAKESARIALVECLKAPGADGDECWDTHIKEPNVCTKGLSPRLEDQRPVSLSDLECRSWSNVFSDNRLAMGVHGTLIDTTEIFNDEPPECPHVPWTEPIIPTNNTPGSEMASLAIASSFVFPGSSEDGFPKRRFRRLNAALPSGAHTVTGDFDGDGDDDVALIRNEEGKSAVRVLTSGPAGMELTHFVDTPLSANFSTEHRWLAGNIDGLGGDDLILLYQHGGDTTASFWASTATGFEKLGLTRTGASYSLNQRWRVGDFNGDGLDDLALIYGLDDGAGLRARFMIFSSTGDGVEQTHFQVPGVSFSMGHRWESGDFDGDDRDDLALVYGYDGFATIMAFSSTGNGFERIAFDRTSAVFSESQQWLAGDTDGDGFDDLTLIYGKNGQASAMRFSGSATGFEQTSFDRLNVNYWEGQLWATGRFAQGGAEDLILIYPY